MGNTVMHDAFIDNLIGWLRNDPSALKVYDVCRECGAKMNVRHIQPTTFDEVQKEYKILGTRYRADIALLKEGNLKSILELKNTSHVSIKKQEFLKEMKIPWIEVDIKALLKDETHLKIIKSHIPGRLISVRCCSRLSRQQKYKNQLLNRSHYKPETVKFLASIRPNSDKHKRS